MRATLSPTLLALSLAALPAAARGAQITIVNVNAEGVGFNDPTPATPVGGNPGTTVGQQRLIAFQHAADIWGAALDSKVEIRIQSSFVPLTCTATAATLGSAGAIQVVLGFPGAEYADTLYHTALANKLAGEDLIPGPTNTSADDIRARFNSNIGATDCLVGTTWYYGLDIGHTASQINLVTVLLHEFAHGLGFSSFANVSTGALLVGFADVYSQFYFDNSTGKFRLEMTDVERKNSAINPRNVVWTGGHVSGAVPTVLAAGTPLLRVNAPSAAAGDYQVGSASFGPALSAAGITGDLVVALDAANAAGPSTIDACSAITNAADVAGRVAVVQRGTCGFVVKAANVQAAGAIAMVVIDNAAGGPPAGLGGTDPTITIPSVRITLADGQAIVAGLPARATLGVDPAVRAGADRAGNALLYTPNPVQPGSSVSHWDTIATPNQLMEPAINQDLRLTVDAPYDLTHLLLRDVGWYPDADLDMVADDAGDQCLGSDLRPTIVIAGRDTGVPNTFFTNGCTVSDLVGRCGTGAANHGAFVSCVAGLGNDLVKMGIVTGAQKGAIQSAAAKAP
jgi:hypothetical protein